jgi:hypothetical protein
MPENAKSWLAATTMANIKGPGRSRDPETVMLSRENATAVTYIE